MSFFHSQPTGQQHQTLIIEEFEPDVFRQLIEYIHTGQVCLQPRTLLGVLNASDFYGLEELRRACSGFVQCCITVDTVCALLSSAERYIQYKCTKSLVQKVLEFVDEHGNEVLNLGSFTLLPQHVVRLILARDELQADEFTKFQAALMWSKKYCDTNPVSASQSSSKLPKQFLVIFRFSAWIAFRHRSRRLSATFWSTFSSTKSRLMFSCERFTRLASSRMPSSWTLWLTRLIRLRLIRLSCRPTRVGCGELATHKAAPCPFKALWILTARTRRCRRVAAVARRWMGSHTANNIGWTTPTIPTTVPFPRSAKPSPRASELVDLRRSAEVRRPWVSGASASNRNQSATRLDNAALAVQSTRATKVLRRRVNRRGVRCRVKAPSELLIAARTAWASRWISRDAGVLWCRKIAARPASAVPTTCRMIWHGVPWDFKTIGKVRRHAVRQANGVRWDSPKASASR